MFLGGSYRELGDPPDPPKKSTEELLQECWDKLDRDAKVDFMKVNNLIGENDIEDFEG